MFHGETYFLVPEPDSKDIINKCRGGKRTMSTEFFSFRVGKFECIAVSDGTHTYKPPAFPPPATLLFSNAPAEQLKDSLARHNVQLEQWVEWASPYICMVVNTGNHLILVDTGAGSGLSPDTGKLVMNLKSVGIGPDDIKTIILTHAHPDHIGGNTDDNGRPAFRKARYVFMKDEWDFWTSERATKTLDEHSRDVLLKYARDNLPPVRGQADLIKDGDEIINGIRAITAPGHTPGHMALSVSSDGEELLCISDTVLHPVHLEHPEWSAVFDVSPGQVVATRRKLLDRAATGKALVIAFHFPFPGLGHIIPKGDAWQWQPVER